MRIYFAWFGVVIALIFLAIVFPAAVITGRLAGDVIGATAGLIFWGTILVRSWMTVRPRPSPQVKPTEYDSMSSIDLIEDQAAQLLAPHLKDRSQICYSPAFPTKDGSPISWFQVILIVGPGDDEPIRNEVHQAFMTILPLIASMNVVRRTDSVSLRARRHVPPDSFADHPLMFIECSWRGSDLAAMLTSGAFEDWHTFCREYINRFDRMDPYNRMQATAADASTSDESHLAKHKH